MLWVILLFVAYATCTPLIDDLAIEFSDNFYCGNDQTMLPMTFETHLIISDYYLQVPEFRDGIIQIFNTDILNQHVMMMKEGHFNEYSYVCSIIVLYCNDRKIIYNPCEKFTNKLNFRNTVVEFLYQHLTSGECFTDDIWSTYNNFSFITNDRNRNVIIITSDKDLNFINKYKPESGRYIVHVGFENITTAQFTFDTSLNFLFNSYIIAIEIYKEAVLNFQQIVLVGYGVQRPHIKQPALVTKWILENRINKTSLARIDYGNEYISSESFNKMKIAEVSYKREWDAVDKYSGGLYNFKKLEHFQEGMFLCQDVWNLIGMTKKVHWYANIIQLRFNPKIEKKICGDELLNRKHVTDWVNTGDMIYRLSSSRYEIPIKCHNKLSLFNDQRIDFVKLSNTTSGIYKISHGVNETFVIIIGCITFIVILITSIMTVLNILYIN